MALANIKAPGKRIAAPEIPQNRPGCGWRPAPPKTYVFRFRGSGCGVVKSFLGGRAAAPLPMCIIMGSAANKTAHCPRFCTAAAHKTRGELSLRVLGNARAVRPIIFVFTKKPVYTAIHKQDDSVLHCGCGRWLFEDMQTAYPSPHPRFSTILGQRGRASPN